MISDVKTVNVKFYDFVNDVKTLLVEVPIEKIKNNKYSLNYIEYLEKDQTVYKDEKRLEEICEFLPKSKRQASYGKDEGVYPFFTSSQKCKKHCDTFDYSDECLIIGTGGIANIKYSSNFSCSTDNFIIKINKNYLSKYIYYYLLHNIEILQKGFIGGGLQHISKKYVNDIKIPIVSLERQQEIIDYCEHSEMFIKQREIEIKNEIEKTKKQTLLFINKN